MTERDRPELIRFLARDQLAQRVQQPAPRAELTVVSGQTPVIRIYDVIDSWGGYWGVSATEVATALDLVPEGTATVEVHLNSPGGEAREGVAIANLLRQHPARVVAVVDGLAASAASMIAMGADEVVMAPASQMMIHDASGGAWGPAAFLEQQARSLHHLSDSYAAAYAGKAGGEAGEWRELMLAETWYSPEEAVAAGLADRLLDASDATADPAAAVARHDLRVFAHAGRESAPAPRLPSAHAPGPRAAVGGTTIEEEAAMSELLNGLRQRLGLADTADETAALAAVDEALNERAETPAPTTPTSALPDGHEAIPAVALAELREQARQGAEARRMLHDQQRAQALDSLRDRFLPANRAAWEAEYDKDPAATVAYLKEAPVMVPTAELGHGHDAEVTDDALYTALFGADQKGA